jgi:hypothetical protein
MATEDGRAKRTRRLAGAGLAGLLLTLAVACVEDGDPPPAASGPAAERLAEQVTARVLAVRTATVRAAVTLPNGSGETSLEGNVELGPEGIRVELSGLVDSDPARVVVIGNDVYLQLGGPGPWLRFPAEGGWPFATTQWATLDFLIEALHYPADLDLLRGLAPTGSTQEIDGESVRLSLVSIDNTRFRNSLSAAQLDRFDLAFTGFLGARVQMYLDDRQLPRRLVASLVGSYPTVDIFYGDWGTPMSITAPPDA